MSLSPTEDGVLEERRPQTIGIGMIGMAEPTRHSLSYRRLCRFSLPVVRLHLTQSTRKSQAIAAPQASVCGENDVTQKVQAVRNRRDSLLPGV